MKTEICEKVQLGVALPSRHFSGLWQNCVLAPPDLQLISQDNTSGIPVHRALLLSFSPTLAPILNSPCCAAPIKMMLSESRGEAVSAAVSLLYTGSCSLAKLLQGHFTFFEVIAEVQEVFKCLSIPLDENCFTVVDKNTTKVKKELCVDDDMLWEDPLEEESVSIDHEFTSCAPLIIDMGEFSSVSSETLVQNEDQHEGESLLVTSNCLKREGAVSPVVKVKRKYVRKMKSEAGEVAEVNSKRKEKKVVEPVEGEVARRRYRCEHCNYSSNNQAALKKHLEAVHAEGAPPPVSCNLCGFACASIGALKAHMTCSHSRPESAFPCHLCPVKPRSQQRLDKHLAWHDMKLKKAQAKKALERKSKKVKVSNANNNENEVGEKTNNLLLANQIVNDIVLSVTERGN